MGSILILLKKKLDGNGVRAMPGSIPAHKSVLIEKKYNKNNMRHLRLRKPNWADAFVTLAIFCSLYVLLKRHFVHACGMKIWL